MIDVPPDRFADLVGEALDSIPDELGRLMDNVNVFVDDDSPPGRLFGLYHGIPLTRREGYGAGGPVMPDRITIFRRTICAAARTEDDVRNQVRVTVIHEVAHHFGIDDGRLDALGWS
ncbi:MAG TPA: metallopeptidase family protein [Acidimicrobiales bacterium]|nr:metallopeptidase family protein [Acidimicrobiales bacterium]